VIAHATLAQRRAVKLFAVGLHDDRMCAGYEAIKNIDVGHGKMPSHTTNVQSFTYGVSRPFGYSCLIFIAPGIKINVTS